ncbi:MAG: hypothetical protein Q9183_004114, partial [Haloplaca sp. 2 TL-2023]
RLPETPDYTPLKPLKRHTWTQKEKQVLYVLGHAYQNPAQQLRRVFNAFFSDEYRRRAGPRTCAWGAMLNEIRRSRRMGVWWTKTDALALRANLLRIALSLNIRLCPSVAKSVDKPHTRRVRKPSSPSSSTPDASEDDWTADESGAPDETSYSTPSKQQNGLLTPPDSQKKVWQAHKNTKAKATRPPVVFRGKQVTS